MHLSPLPSKIVSIAMPALQSVIHCSIHRAFFAVCIYCSCVFARASTSDWYVGSLLSAKYTSSECSLRSPSPLQTQALSHLNRYPSCGFALAFALSGTYLTSYQGPFHFSVCNIEKLGMGLGTRLTVTYLYSTLASCKHHIHIVASNTGVCNWAACRHDIMPTYQCIWWIFIDFFFGTLQTSVSRSKEAFPFQKSFYAVKFCLVTVP